MAGRSTPFAPSTPCRVDLASSDKARSIEFYSTLMGLTREDAGPEPGNHVNFHQDLPAS